MTLLPTQAAPGLALALVGGGTTDELKLGTGASGLANLPVAYGLSEEAARSWGLNLSHAIKDGEPDLFNEPGIFILDEDGTLFWSSTATMPFGRPSLDDVIAGVRYAQEQDYPAHGAA